ncbi:hypothetical protein [Leucobacter massiliensis]|uniref:hypothetical protein n=1 Tax=Leucobacter massiliensis TaxID=1686285 RepID=UPI0011B2366B|nr:hypothetical protein [Leucobacter massiliensis]
MSFFDDYEWKTILELLSGATSAGKLQWEKGPKTDEGEFTTNLVGESSYVIKSRDGDGEFPYVLMVLNSKGTLLDSFEAVPYDPDHFEYQEEVNSKSLEELYTGIRRQISGAAAAFDSITTSLSALQPDPKPF